MWKELDLNLPKNSNSTITFRENDPHITLSANVKDFISKTDLKFFKVFYNEEENKVEFLLSHEGKSLYSTPWNPGVTPFGISSVPIKNLLLGMGFNYGTIQVELVKTMSAGKIILTGNDNPERKHEDIYARTYYRQPFITLKSEGYTNYISFNETIKTFAKKTGRRHYNINFNPNKGIVEFVLADKGDFNVYSNSKTWSDEAFYTPLTRKEVINTLTRMGFKEGRIPVKIDAEGNKFTISLEENNSNRFNF